LTYVLCWDIDGTLLTTARAGVFALEQAARDLGGEPADLSTVLMAGLTDVEIARIVLRATGIVETPEMTHRFLRLYEQHLPERLHWRAGFVLPGVRELLVHLSRRADVVQLLLTGNTRAGAKAKLEHYGLAEFFVDGAFADDHAERPGIARRALAVARELVPDVLDEQCYVIGDTPFDVACGQAVGMRTVAVAGFTYDAQVLRGHDPWLLLDGLPSPVEFECRLELR
jgi:phosphoglycolate phosphatase